MRGGRAVYRLLPCITALALAGPGAWAGDITYKYRENDGTVWFTDRKPSGARMRDFEFLGYHGRPPASSSCRGASRADLERRAERIRTPMERLAARHGVDRLLVKAIIAVESCFDPRAVSRVGARGLMQLMPGTAGRLGVQDAFDVNENLGAGISFFSRLHDRYGGDTRLALAAYNAGPSAVDRHQDVPPYTETQQYVRRVLARWHAYRGLAEP